MSETDSSEIIKETNEVVGSANLKTVGEGPAFYQNMQYANAVANQQLSQQAAQARQDAMNNLQVTVLGKLSEMIIHTSPSEGGVDVTALGQLAKLLQNTPPQT